MLERPDRILSAVSNGFGGGTVLVVGDVMLDRYLWGEVERISPEAPVPVVRLAREAEVPGGAGNVALNLAGLGLKPALISVVGDDAAGARVRDLLRDAGVETRWLLTVGDRPTTVKERIMGGHQQMLRLDREVVDPLAPEVEDRLVASARECIGAGASVVVLSDYAKGVLSALVASALISEARSVGLPVIVDPKGLDFSKYAGATAVSPNRSELAAVTRLPEADLDGLREAGRRLMVDLDLEFLVVTLGGQGIELIRRRGGDHIPAVAREVFDVSGAGDTVIATLAAGLCGGLPVRDGLALAAVAAGVVIGKVGTVPVTGAELSEALLRSGQGSHDGNLYALDDLLNTAGAWRENGHRIVFTNGCFDLLHAGHITLLDRARSEGDRLIVGLNSDDSTRRLKGAGRPVVPQGARARVLGALAAVDAVVIFDEDTPLEVIRALRPDVLVKGSDYVEEDVVGAADVKSWGGRVVLVPLEEGHGTSEMIRRIGDS